MSVYRVVCGMCWLASSGCSTNFFCCHCTNGTAYANAMHSTHRVVGYESAARYMPSPRRLSRIHNRPSSRLPHTHCSLLARSFAETKSGFCAFCFCSYHWRCWARHTAAPDVTHARPVSARRVTAQCGRVRRRRCHIGAFCAESCLRHE